uniref:NADH-ubiquinone oxidoreductase chain 1 n=1 Tax=Melanastera paucipunctata TaxID=2218046 RepID=A0A344A2A4_9HEMI|nr:NADH dehydrogenase subunit 1 [Diclidophlebia paucipunctata]AWU48895.1 NADH dehydrogenase subunit 1 [Diclidophlebia paucipunctata]
MLINFICLIFMMVFSLLSVAFLTLMERKVLSYIQLRKGPNKVGVLGVFQPFSDAVKLFTKEYIVLLKINFYPYWMSPTLGLFISLSLWLIYPWIHLLISWKYSILFMFTILSMGVYSIMVSGWVSNSSYSILGAIRSIAQSISYEVSFFMIFICLIMFISSFNFFMFNFMQSKIWLVLMTFPIFFMAFISFLAELNRTPFDFSEGESELVSGFNIEYGGSGFAFIFLAEYLNILFASLLLSMVFLGSVVVIWFKLMLVSFLIILIRGVLPRYRYDKLMNLCWKSFLMVCLNMVLFYTFVLLLPVR